MPFDVVSYQLEFLIFELWCRLPQPLVFTGLAKTVCPADEYLLRRRYREGWTDGFKTRQISRNRFCWKFVCIQLFSEQMSFPSSRHETYFQKSSTYIRSFPFGSISQGRLGYVAMSMSILILVSLSPIKVPPGFHAQDYHNFPRSCYFTSGKPFGHLSSFSRGVWCCRKICDCCFGFCFGLSFRYVFVQIIITPTYVLCFPIVLRTAPFGKGRQDRRPFVTAKSMHTKNLFRLSKLNVRLIHWANPRGQRLTELNSDRSQTSTHPPNFDPFFFWWYVR